MNISFGAKLLTKPSQFILPTDTEDECKAIRQRMAMLYVRLNEPEVQALTANDTVELIRVKNKKNLFRYKIKYSREGLKPFFIHIDAGNVMRDFNSKFAFEQIAVYLSTIFGGYTAERFSDRNNCEKIVEYLFHRKIK